MSDNWKPNRSAVAKQGYGRTKSQRGEKAVNKAKIDHGTMNFFKEGGTTMATKGKFPFALFEKSGKDKEVKGKGKEGSKKEEAFDKKQSRFAKGGSVDGVAQRGKTKGKVC